jgi:hypothetical protein
MTTATWITIALLAPFWWAMGLFALAVLGDVSPGWRPRVSRLFNWLKSGQNERPTSTAVPRRYAA